MEVGPLRITPPEFAPGAARLTAQRLGCERNKSTTPPWAWGMGTAGTVHAAGRETVTGSN